MVTATEKNIRFLIPMMHVTEVQRALDFYAKLGFDPLHTLKGPDGLLQWAHAKSADAHLMFARDSESGKIEKESTAVLYLYSADLVKVREEMLAQGVKVSDIAYPIYMPKGEVCLSDPDG